MSPRSRQAGSLREALKSSPGYLGFVLSGFVWNFALQIAAPFFNVYLVTELGASVGLVGLFTSLSSLAALGGQLVFGKVLDRRGAVFLQLATGFPDRVAAGDVGLLHRPLAGRHQ
jgi:MFS family permease